MKSRGYVLLSVLIFMIIFSLVGIHALNASLNSLKNNEHLWQRTSAWYYAHQALTSIEKQLLTYQPTCMLPWISATEVARKPIDWWQHRCSGNLAGIRYYYCLELLAKEPCMKGRSNDQLLYNAEFYRITLIAVPNLKGAKIVLQSIMVKAQQQSSICTEKPRILHVGRQLWRAL